jgi:hypothetical protein
MDLSKLPPFVAMSLGLLGCVAEPCLSFVPESESGTSTTTGTSTGSTETTYVGPCLGAIDTSGTTDTSETFTTSACLSPPPLDTGTDTDTGTGTDTGGTDTGTGTDTGGTDTGTGTDTGMMLDEPHPRSRAAAVERVVSRGTLPADVLERLRALTGTGKG